MNDENAEIIRKRYKYRRLILSGKLKLPHREAAKLLGPDCVYHLYNLQAGEKHDDLSRKPGKTSG